MFPRNSIGSDNHSGVHPKVLEAILKANGGHAPSYGTDSYSESIQDIFKNHFGPQSKSFFVFNGTAANVLCLRALMKSYEAVICSDVSHLHMDECGAPENAIGCKLHVIHSKDGKITPEQIRPFLIRGGDQHYAQPRVVSITQPTEYGTVYSLEEMRELRRFTKENGLKLHVDGSRLIYAAHKLGCNLHDLTAGIGIDALSFGGTKNGLLFGELVVLYDESAAKDFKYIRKQNLQLPSKMRFLAAQFDELLGPAQLWKEIAGRGHEMALYLKKQLQDIKAITVTQKVEANAVFARIPKEWLKPLREEMFFYVWDEFTYEVRWMMSFDIEKSDIDKFVQKLKSLNV